MKYTAKSSRIFSFIFALCLSLVVTSISANQQNDEFVDGKDYIKLSDKFRSKKAISKLLQNDANKTQVVLFFSYGCPACAAFDPYFEKWARAQNTNHLAIIRVPVAFHEEWEELAKMFYTMKDLDPNLSLNARIFTAIHEDDLRLWQESAMEDFFVQNGYNSATFQKEFHSERVDQQAQNAEELSVAYEIAQTPTIIINKPSGMYRLNLSLADDNSERCIEILNALAS